MPASQSRNFVFTLNNYSDEELALVGADPPVPPVRYVMYGKEVGAQGTPHLQGALCCSKLMTVTGVKKLPLMKRAHVEMMRGRLEDSEKYCSKESALISVGSRPKSQNEKGDGEKLRHHEINRLAKLGLMDEIEELAPDVWRRDYKTLKMIAKDHIAAPDVIHVLENEWIYGPTGTGKTRSVWERFPDAYIKKADTHWWDGYQGQETVIIDDFDKYFVKQGYHLKIWADHRPFLAETKGGAMMIRPKRIIVTSNYAMKDIWNDETTLEPLTRRFKEIHYLLKLYDDTEPPAKRQKVDKMEFTEYVTPFPLFEKQDALVAGFVDPKLSVAEEVAEYVRSQYKKI